MPSRGFDEALGLLRRATTPHGILASVTDVANYNRVWARDGIACGLAGLVAGEDGVTAGLRSTLETLARSQGPDGQIPSNVLLDSKGQAREVSYGGLAGRVDTIPWFVIGVCNYSRITGDRRFAEEMAPAMQRGLDLLTVWEFNRRGLVYVPQGGDWADEYIHHGYVFLVQVLRLWALRCHAALLETEAQASADRADRLTELLRANYWPRRSEQSADHACHPYHPRAYRAYLEERGEPDHWLTTLTPAGYKHRFDPLSNALSVLLGLPDSDQRGRLLDHGHAVRRELPSRLLPAFWPPIEAGDPEWAELQATYRDQFNNAPGEYHNGGVWPILSGWWGLALCAADRTDEAKELLDAVHAFNRLQPEGGAEWGFCEYGNARTGAAGGTPLCSWSAAGAVLLERAAEGSLPFFGES